MIAHGKSGDVASLYLIKRRCARGLATVLAGCAGIALMAGTTPTAVHAAGCEGQNASSDTGATSQAASIDVLEETIAQAKASSGIGATPVYGGIAYAGVRTDHDGYRLKNGVPQTDCIGAPIPPINELQPFVSNSHSLGAIGEIDLSNRLSMPGYTFKVGGGISGKWVRTDYEGDNFTPATAAAGGPSIGVRTGNGSTEDDGVLFDFYSLIAARQTYLITTSSFGFGNSDIQNLAFTGLQFTSPDGTPAGSASTAPATFGGGRGETDYDEYSFSGTLGHVFQVPHGARQLLIDVSGGLQYSNYERDGFTDSAGVRYSDATTRTFAGVAAITIAMPLAQYGWQYSPFVKGAIKQRFDFDSKVTVTNPTTGLCAPGGVVDANGCGFTATYDLESDDTSYRVGAGFTGGSDDGHTVSAFEIFYGGAGDFNEVGGRAQLLFRLN
jgi:hypothetical protein